MKASDVAPEIRAKAPHLFDQLGDIELPQPKGYQLLVVQYARPSKIGSIILTDKTRDEDRYQGRYGLVVDMGADAFGDTKRFPGEHWAAVGDTVIWPALQNASSRLDYAGVTLALLPDTSILATIPASVDLSRLVGA